MIIDFMQSWQAIDAVGVSREEVESAFAKMREIRDIFRNQKNYNIAANVNGRGGCFLL